MFFHRKSVVCMALVWCLVKSSHKTKTNKKHWENREMMRLRTASYFQSHLNFSHSCEHNWVWHHFTASFHCGHFISTQSIFLWCWGCATKSSLKQQREQASLSHHKHWAEWLSWLGVNERDREVHSERNKEEEWEEWGQKHILYSSDIEMLMQPLFLTFCLLFHWLQQHTSWKG